MHVIDSLAAGGAERVAVNLTNELARQKFGAYLCVTRRDGPLRSEVSSHVRFINISRRSRFDLRAIWKFIHLVRSNRVDIIHAHSSSVFLAVIAKLFLSKVKVIWHVHYGGYSSKSQSTFLYRPLLPLIDGVIAVNAQLQNWLVQKLHVSPEEVWLLPNFVEAKEVQPRIIIPGIEGFRIVCVANIRQEKGHTTLIHAMKRVVDVEPRAHLILVGASNNPSVKEEIDTVILKLGLSKSISLLGARDDVQEIIANCAIGVISSITEGLPLSLLEYGSASLPVVATDVGECAQVLDHGRVGILVPPGSPTDLANGILSFLANPTMATKTGRQLYERVRKFYSADSALEKLEWIYYKVLGKEANPHTEEDVDTRAPAG